jgi:glycosyltransferase involved in cell wall biosynthesis
MRIAHLIWSFTVGGAETRIVDLLNTLGARVEAMLLVMNRHYDTQLLEAIPKHVKVRLVNRPKGSPNPIPLLRARGYLQRFQPDIVVCHNSSLVSLLRGIRTHKAVHIHGYTDPIENFSASYGTIFAISRDMRDNIRRRTMHPNVRLVYNGIHANQIATRRREDRGRERGSPFRMVQVGRIIPEIKGHDVSLQALARCSREHNWNEWQLDIIGEGPGRGAVQSMADSLGLSERIRFLGTLPQEEIHATLSTYDLLLQPSRRESFGNTIIEAMAARVPVLVSSIPAPMEIIDNGNFGYAFKRDDVVDCASQIWSIVSQAGSHEQLAKLDEARTRVLGRFDIGAMAESFMEEYQSILSQRGSQKQW